MFLRQARLNLLIRQEKWFFYMIFIEAYLGKNQLLYVDLVTKTDRESVKLSEVS